MTFDAPIFPLSFHLCCAASLSCGLLVYFYCFSFSIAYCAYTFIFPWTLDVIVLYSHAPLLPWISHLFLPHSLSSISFLAVLS